jgi:hypothetical protein
MVLSLLAVKQSTAVGRKHHTAMLHWQPNKILYSFVLLWHAENLPDVRLVGPDDSLVLLLAVC